MTLEQAKKAVLSGKRVTHGGHASGLELTTFGPSFPLHGGGVGRHWYVGFADLPESDRCLGFRDPVVGWLEVFA
jgi:hypothetical protein